MPSLDEDKFLNALAQAAPRLKAAIDKLTALWLSPILEGKTKPTTRDKHFNDAIWGTITLYPWEVTILDTPLFQRLRGVKQTGLAHLVFPGATHDRFTHICGVVEASQRMMENLNRNAAARRRLGPTQHPSQEIAEPDRYVIRLAALIHDVGHGPFSHAIEPVLKQHYLQEFGATEQALQQHLFNVSDVAASESVAVLMVASPAFQSLLANSIMSKLIDGRPIKAVACRLIMAIVGASDGTPSGCLGGVISNQIDADKLDYMARDAHYAGLPIEFDTDRLITKLELLTVEESVLSRRLIGLLERVKRNQPPRYTEIGIAHGGTGAFEQMLIGRIFLYDRLYHHHKVRTADAMAQRLVHYALAPGESLDISKLYTPLSDDTVIRAFGGLVQIKDEATGKAFSFPSTDKSLHLAKAILDRSLYRRAFAIAGRFIAGLNAGAPVLEEERTEGAGVLQTEDEQDAERSRVLVRVNNDLADFSGRLNAEHDIVELARSLSVKFPEGDVLREQGKSIDDHHVIVDLPKSPYPARITTIACMESGRLDVPDLFYDPARWADVYSIQRRTAYVFSDSKHLELVALASRVWFLRKYICVLDESADQFSKTDTVINRDWFARLQAAGALSTKEGDYLVRPRLVHGPFTLERRHVPRPWLETTPDFVDAFNLTFNQILEDGIPALAELELTAALRCLFNYVQTRSEDRTFVTQELRDEKELQTDLTRSLRDQGLTDITEGSKRAGGETDLVIGRRVLVENKLIKTQTDDPFAEVPRAGLQGRRYVLPTGQNFVITVVGYRSATENGKVRPNNCVRIRQLAGIDTPFVEVRVVVRYGDSVPSSAR